MLNLIKTILMGIIVYLILGVWLYDIKPKKSKKK